MNKTILTAIAASAVCGSLFGQSVIPNKISSDTTLSANAEYLLDGYTYVMSGATLTIEPGAHIYANEETGADASALIVTRGGKIMAQGTPDNPIIFEPITAKSVDLGPDDTGMWVGVIILVAIIVIILVNVIPPLFSKLDIVDTTYRPRDVERQYHQIQKLRDPKGGDPSKGGGS